MNEALAPFQGEVLVLSVPAFSIRGISLNPSLTSLLQGIKTSLVMATTTISTLVFSPSKDRHISKRRELSL